MLPAAQRPVQAGAAAARRAREPDHRLDDQTVRPSRLFTFGTLHFTDGCAPRLLDELEACIAGHFDVEHSTFQLEAAAHASHEPGTH